MSANPRRVKMNKYHRTLIENANVIGKAYSGRCVGLSVGRKHLRVILCINGTTRFAVTGKTPSDYHSIKNHSKDVKHTYIQLEEILRGR